MLVFITQYWIEVLFGLIVGVFTYFFRRYIKLEKEARTQERADFKKMLLEEIEKKNQEWQKEDKEIRKDIELLKKGVLSFQGRIFKDHCREFLKSKEVNLDEFEDLEAEHNVYNGLGGNHEGDVLFGLAKKKVEEELTKRHE